MQFAHSPPRLTVLWRMLITWDPDKVLFAIERCLNGVY